MKRMWIAVAFGLLLATAGQAQTAPGGGNTTGPRAFGDPIRIPVRHADPWAIKFMLEGQSLISPEVSTILAFNGIAPAAGAIANALFRNGILVVNAADNSLWFFPFRDR